MASRKRGVGGRGIPPICKQHDPHNLLLLQTLTCFSYRKHGWPKRGSPEKSGGVSGRAGGGAATPNKMIRTTFFDCKHGDDMMPAFYGRYDRIEKRGAGVEAPC